ncbi:hypothetical protein C8N47_1334 [Mangrovibacterium marinum]|uniref:PKD domain-containing protein n=1 Tax=Mangrovibacterium marinum TaxID=1639118 RepID=A0A2T5BWZ3_9BACT|nr:hypothetical protein [Mangrovibacterium marinum]PTN04239.1 hypothetical protein C8N47_1334 [Mangrovibacterium marinum]
MKNKILSLLFVAIAMIVSTSAFADNETVASLGGSVTFVVNTTDDNGNANAAGYQWEIRNSSGTPIQTFSDNSSSATVDFTTANGYEAGVYTIWVQFEDGNGCLSDPISRTITINDSSWNLAGATNLTTCSLLTVYDSGNSSNPDETKFNVTIASAFGTYTVVYEVGGVEFTESNYTSGSTITVAHNSTTPDVTGVFTNTGDSNKDVIVKVTSVTDSNGFVVPLETTDRYTVVVNPRPTITF